MAAAEILAGLEADGILRVLPPDPEAIDADAALYVLEDAVAAILDVLRPVLTAADRDAPRLLDLPAVRGAAHLLSGALLVHQTARLYP